MQGQIKKWMDRGFGFIIPDDGSPDIFVHCSDIIGLGRAAPDVGARVEYEIALNDRSGRLKAVNVKLL